MATRSIITIGRTFGSGGRQIGRMLADRLGIPYYDKELLTVAAQKSGMSEGLFEINDEKPASSLLYSFVSGRQLEEMPINQKLFLAQFDAIQHIAEQGPCIIVGRCADYALREYPNLFRVFVYAPLEARVGKLAAEEGVDIKKATSLVQKNDKSRASYYSFYTGRKWGVMDDYDLCLNSQALGLKGCVETIMAALSQREQA